jgi:hypothetical protein
MLDLFESLFDSSGFPPRWRCGTWTLTQGWLHIASDLGVWLAYTSIPIVLAFFVIRKKHLPFRGLFILFTAFILACGLTHLMEAIIFWWPAYRLAGVLKFLTALVSWSTVVALIQTTPSLLAMRTPEELEREVSARRAAEESLTSKRRIGCRAGTLPDDPFEHRRRRDRHRFGRTDHVSQSRRPGADQMGRERRPRVTARHGLPHDR